MELLAKVYWCVQVYPDPVTTIAYVELTKVTELHPGEFKLFELAATEFKLTV